MALNKIIMIVDDVAATLDQEKKIIEKIGLPVITASSGAEAIKTIITEKPFLVFLDLIMPDMNGDAICQFLKKRQDLVDISVIMLTGRDSEEDFQRCFRCGCDAYITKPLDFDDVKEKIEIVLDDKGLSL